MTDKEDPEELQDTETPQRTEEPQGAGDEQGTGSDASQQRIEKMEHGIEHVGDEIEDAKKEARDATALDPQPLAGTESEPADTKIAPVATEGEPDSSS